MGAGGIPQMAVGAFTNPRGASGSNKQARIAQQMAQAEQAARQAVTSEARAGAQRMNLAAQSPQQLAALEKGLSAANAQVDADLRQLAAIDPAIMEASKQVLGLLQGGHAAVNDPMMQQRNQQRAQLVDSLRAQYGPGAESSSIGQRALQQFDMQSNTAFAQNQQNTLGNLFGMATTRVQGHGFGQLMQTANGFGDYQTRQLMAEQAGTGNILNAMQGEVQGAGAPFVQQMMQANFQRKKYDDLSGDMRQIGRTWGTFGASNKGGGQQQQAPNAYSVDNQGAGSFDYSGGFSSGSQHGGGSTRQVSPYFG